MDYSFKVIEFVSQITTYCHTLTLKLVMSLFGFGHGVIWVGILCSFLNVFVFPCFGRVGKVLNQGQLSIVVSDWEPYLGSFSPTWCLWVVIFCLVFSAPDRTV